MPRMLWVVLVVWIAAGQTQIDLSTQAKNVPIKSGASLPNTCAVGRSSSCRVRRQEPTCMAARP